MGKVKDNQRVDNACPCGGASYAQCCEPLHLGAAAATPLALMRSRYSAYVLRLGAYLRHSWHPQTRPATIDFDANCVWLGLSIQSSAEAAELGTVEFIARYRIGGGSAVRLQEHSEFVRIDGRWVYWRAKALA
jgi:SEC-C motif domain protein